ncbi:MAG: PEGA domain-containing protein [Thermoanaerobaculales bacterium]|nr:PEGA domain-containing protein [Thermoanaerobaculales bacterium]
MKCIRCLGLIFIMSLSVVSFAGDIQVTCESGLRVLLDGKFVGTSSSKEDGLSLVNVKRGTHTLRVEKEGFLPQTFEVDILDLPIEIVVEDFTPEPPAPRKKEAAAPKVTQRVGNLIVTSAPQNCLVEIDGRAETKNTPHLSIGGLTAGEHTISFSKAGYDRISGVIKIQPGAEVTVRGNLKAGKVEILHEGKGSFRLISKPMRCTVRFRGEIIEKTTQKLNLSFIPAGEYRIVVSWRGLKLSRKVLIANDQRTTIEVSFMKGDEPFVVSYEPE